MNVCVIIPTFNESQTIAQVIKQVKARNLELVVVDDGSEDKTSEIARENNAIVLKNKINQGKGASLMKGFAFALDHGFDAVITMDGDGQHAPEDLQNFINAAERSESGIFIGNRMLRVRNMPRVRYFTNKFMSWLISKLAGQEIPDTQCGYRLLKKALLKKLNLKTVKYETESETLIEASRLGFKIESVPIKTLYLNEVSHINPFVDTLRFIRFLFRELWTT